MSGNLSIFLREVYVPVFVNDQFPCIRSINNVGGSGQPENVFKKVSSGRPGLSVYPMVIKLKKHLQIGTSFDTAAPYGFISDAKTNSPSIEEIIKRLFSKAIPGGK